MDVLHMNINKGFTILGNEVVPISSIIRAIGDKEEKNKTKVFCFLQSLSNAGQKEVREFVVDMSIFDFRRELELSQNLANRSEIINYHG